VGVTPRDCLGLNPSNIDGRATSAYVECCVVSKMQHGKMFNDVPGEGETFSEKST
jgi:hypothetical protein